MIYADRLVGIIYDGIFLLGSESESETRSEEFVNTYPKYGNNATILKRYLGYHQERQSLIKKA